jgi:hypothetical protein
LAAPASAARRGIGGRAVLALVRDRRVAVVLAGLCVLVVGVFAKLPETILPIASDTGMFATYARIMLQGGRPYVNFYDIHPPVGFLYWILVEALAGTDWSRTCAGTWGGVLAPQPCVSLVAHVLDLALTLVAAGLSYAIARRLGLSVLVGLLAAVFVAWFANESMISMEGSTPTKLTLVPCTLAVYLYLRAFPGGRLGWVVGSGAAAMVGVLAKQPGLMTLITLVVYTLVSAAIPRRRVLLGIAVGTVVVLLPVVLYMAAIGSLGGFLDQPWSYNIERLVTGYWQTPAGLTSPATRVDRVVAQAAGLLFVGAILGGLSLCFGPAPGQQRLLLLWGLFSLVAIAGFREFAQVVPAFALLAAVGFGRLWESAGRNGLGLGRPLAGRLSLLVVFGTIFVLTSSFQLMELRRAIYESGPSAKPGDPEQISAYLRQQVPPGPLFIWGNEAHLYALSGRDPATRFLIGEFPRAASPRAAVSRQQVLDDLRQHPPAAIVVDPHTDDVEMQLSGFPALQHLIEVCYSRVPNMPTGWTLLVTTTDPATCVPNEIRQV